MCFLAIFFSIALFVGCNTAEEKQETEDDNTCEQWKVLKQAFATLLQGDFDSFLSLTDASQLKNKNVELIKNALKQKYARENFNMNSQLRFTKLNNVSEDTVEVYYSIISTDTVYDMQKMRKSDGIWKILLF